LNGKTARIINGNCTDRWNCNGNRAFRKVVDSPNREPGSRKAFAVAVGYPCSFVVQNPRHPRPTLFSDAVEVAVAALAPKAAWQ
jgi:hypothetical protein